MSVPPQKRKAPPARAGPSDKAPAIRPMRAAAVSMYERADDVTAQSVLTKVTMRMC